jgi:Tfp pilus assembly protein PilP
MASGPSDARRMSVRITAMALAIALLALPGCQDDRTTGPTTAEFSSARQELAVKNEQGPAAVPQRPKAAPKPPPAAQAPAEAFGAVGGDFHYDPKGKRDPFRSFEWEQMRLALAADDSRGPLEQFDVNQLSLVGVVWHAHNARALVQDPSGMSYIVAEGAKIGKNNGRVMRIDDNLMVVKETYEDWNGEETTKDIEMRIRVTEGG